MPLILRATDAEEDLRDAGEKGRVSVKTETTKRGVSKHNIAEKESTLEKSDLVGHLITGTQFVKVRFH